MSAFVAGNAEVSVAATVFCGVFVQALPFLGSGVVISGLIAAFVSADRLARWLPRRPGVAVAAPGSRCGAAGLRMRIGAGGAATVRRRGRGRGRADLHARRARRQPGGARRHRGGLPGQPAMVRPACVASLLTALTVGLLWLRWGRIEWVTRRMPAPHDTDASAMDGIHRGGPPRLPAGRFLPGAGCRRRRRPAVAVPAWCSPTSRGTWCSA